MLMPPMQEMQNDLLNQCRFDGGYPKPVIIGMGGIAMANNKEEEDRLHRDNLICWVVWIVVNLVFWPVFILW
jgi:hypothetical protein